MPKRILLADDSITIQKVVELTFSDGDYEVTAVNNGARAIQKLGEMRPDIILSDIIMPEKNGYEVCEYVKSHPEHRNIPVVLLTGTFEPFDPDRAEKAGCDAVVTKPFESQSLIHKVEELIANAQAAATTVAAPLPTAPPPAPEPVEEAPSPWMDDAPIEAEARPSPFTTATGSFPAPPEAYTHGTDIFGAAPPTAPTPAIEFDNADAAPFGAPPPADEFSGETRAFPRMTFDDFQQAGAEPAAPAAPAAPSAPEPSPWDEPDFGGETRAFGKMTFDDLQAMAPQAIPNLDPEPQPEAEAAPDAPFGAPPEAEEFSGETRAFPRMSFDELQQQTATPPPPPPAPPQAEPEPEPVAPAAASAWDEPSAAPFGEADEAPLGGGDTNAFPRMSFEDLEQQMGTPAPEPEPEAEPLPASLPTSTSEASPWDEQPAFGGETQAFPKMSYEELAASAPEPEPAPWEQQPPPPPPPAWTPADEPVSDVAPANTSPADEIGEPAGDPELEEQPFASAEPALEEAPVEAAAEPEASPEAAVEQEPGLPGQIAAAAAIAEPDEPVVPPASLAPESAAIPIRGSDLSDDQVDRIARRVVELMSDHVIRNIAWEVIPDLAEMVVKERIRQLESEA